MTGNSSDRFDKSGNNKISLATVKEEFAPPTGNSLFVDEKVTEIGYEILKEDHEILLSDYESLKQRFKDVEETYMVTKLQLENKTREFEEKKIHLLEVKSMEKSGKERYKKMFEELKIVVSEGKARINEMINQEFTLEKSKEKNKELEKLENKYGKLEEKLDVVEIEVSSLKSLYDTANAVISGKEKTENLADETVNYNNTVVTDAIVISDDSEGEDGNTLKEQCKKVINLLIKNQASEDIFIPKSVKHATSSSSSSS